MTTAIDSEIPLTIACLQFTIAVCDLIANTSSKSPLFLLVLWWLFCVYFQLIVLNLFPFVILVWFSCKWKIIKQEPLENATLGQLMIKCEQKLEKVNCLSWESGYARESFIYFVTTYFMWISLQQVLKLSTLFTLVGFAFIVWKSEWPLPIRKKYTAMKTLFTRERNLNSLWERMNHNEQETTFLFEIFENQRFNLFTGQWEDTTFPFERSTWTDSTHHPVSSKSQIALPFFWCWIDDSWSSKPWSYSNIIWSTSTGDKWYHNKTRRRIWTRTACTKINESSRRRSSVYYSQKSTVYEFPSEKFQAGDISSKVNETSKSDCTNETTITPSLSKERIETPAIISKPPSDLLCCDEKNISSSLFVSPFKDISRDKSKYTTFHRRSKRLSSTTTSKDAIWKSIVKT